MDTTNTAALLKSNEAMVRKVAHYYSRRTPGVDMEDLLQEGRMGILRAGQTWDASKGAWSTHAYPWVRAMIVRYCQKNVGIVRAATNNALSTLVGCVSASAKVSEHDDGGTTVQDLLRDDSMRPDLAMEPTIMDRLDALNLNTRERTIVEERLMREGTDRTTLESLGGRWGCTRERVRQIEVSTRAKLATIVK